MSASGDDGERSTDDAVVVREEGIEVEKSHETDGFPVPAIVFSIRSERDESVEIRLTDRVPDGVSMDDVGFHPEYGSEFWSVEGRTLVFERDLAGGAEAETVYGLRGPDADETDRFLGEPTIEVWTGGEDDSSFVEDINDQLTRSATVVGESDDGESADPVAGADDSETDGTDGMAGADEGNGEGAEIEYGIEDGRIEKIERDEHGEDSGRSGDGDRNEDDAATTEDASMDEDTPNDAEADETGTDENRSDEAGADGVTTDAIAARLARELRTGNVDSEDREVLREVLSPRESVSARIDHLRSQVNDVAAYADALEAFLDENGSGRTLVRQQSERLDALREDVETVTERAGTNRADVEQVQGDVEAIEGDVEAVERDIEAFQAAISDLDEEVERIDERFASIDERFEESEARSAAVAERLDSVESHQEAIDERLDALEASHESDISDLREEMEARIDERVSAVERTTEEIETDVESIEAWRAQLAGALGGTGSRDTGATESKGDESGSEES